MLRPAVDPYMDWYIPESHIKTTKEKLQTRLIAELHYIQMRSTCSMRVKNVYGTYHDSWYIVCNTTQQLRNIATAATGQTKQALQPQTRRLIINPGKQRHYAAAAPAVVTCRHCVARAAAFQLASDA
jgi:hypothetical protein